MYVVNFLSKEEATKLVDSKAYDVINYLLRKVAFSQPESYDVNDKNSDIQITKEFLEQWIAQACALKSIGSGNYPIDVYKENQYGIDVKFVSAKTDINGQLVSSQSNETSLGQNFQGFGKDLDQSFEKKEYGQILNGWINILKEKLNQPLKDLGLKVIYYFIFIRAGNKIHLAIAELNLNNLDNLTVKNSSSTSVFINNFINENYGNVKIYKSKKRMELRLYAKNLQTNNFLTTWDFKNLYPSAIPLRDIVGNNKLEYHINAEFKKFFDN
jgi:hypothetical protein